MKLKASALYYALIFSILIAILSSLLILFAYYARMELNTYEVNQKLLRNCHSGLEYLKSENFSFERKNIDLFNLQKDSVILEKKHWGLFDIISSTAVSGKKNLNKTALLGVSTSIYQNTALYLTNMKSLSISGNTKIVGNAYLSKAGIKRTNIEGKNYVGKELIYGKKFLSEKMLPQLNNQTQKYLNEIQQKSDYYESNEEDLSKLYSETKIENSFSEQTMVFKSNARINLNNLELFGNIAIYSTKEIIVDRSTNLNNVLLVAPAVIIKNRTKGSFHVIAKDSVIIGENVHLTYPSSIAIKSDKNAFVKIANKSVIIGDVILNGKNSSKRTNFITIEKDVKIEGNVYCNGIVSLKGDIHGSLFCQKFYLKTPSAIYENYLLDGIIDNSKRDKNYLSGFLFEEKTNKNIIAWY